MPVIVKNIPYIARRFHSETSAPPTPPAALALVAAVYDPGASIRLTFDRAIDIAGLVGNQIVVDDGVIFSVRYAATGAAALVEPDSVEIALAETGSTPISTVELTASASTGIVAADDGGEWAGATGLNLPFP